MASDVRLPFQGSRRLVSRRSSRPDPIRADVSSRTFQWPCRYVGLSDWVGHRIDHRSGNCQSDRLWAAGDRLRRSAVTVTVELLSPLLFRAFPGSQQSICEEAIRRGNKVTRRFTKTLPPAGSFFIAAAVPIATKLLQPTESRAVAVSAKALNQNSGLDGGSSGLLPGLRRHVPSAWNQWHGWIRLCLKVARPRQVSQPRQNHGAVIAAR